MKTDENQFLRVDWEPGGWSWQESQNGEFESYFGKLHASTDDGVQEDLTGERGTNALKRLKKVHHALARQPSYTCEWNSRAAAEHVYQALVEPVEVPSAGSNA